MTKKMMMYVGLNDKDAKVQKIDTIEAYKIIEGTLYNVGIDGCTLYNARGSWQGMPENTIICEVFEYEKPQIYKACEVLKIALNQEAIALNEVLVEVEFF